MKLALWTALGVLLLARGAEALKEPYTCYILDAILFLYGIVLTFFYCRLKIQFRKKSKMATSNIYEKVEGLYTGLSTRDPETYTTLELPKVEPRTPPTPQRGEEEEAAAALAE